MSLWLFLSLSQSQATPLECYSDLWHQPFNALSGCRQLDRRSCCIIQVPLPFFAYITNKDGVAQSRTPNTSPLQRRSTPSTMYSNFDPALDTNKGSRSAYILFRHLAPIADFNHQPILTVVTAPPQHPSRAKGSTPTAETLTLSLPMVQVQAQTPLT